MHCAEAPGVRLGYAPTVSTAVYVAPAGPVKLAAAPLSTIALVPTFRQLGSTATGPSLGWNTPLPVGSTASADGSAACALWVTVVCAVAALSAERESNSSAEAAPPL